MQDNGLKPCEINFIALNDQKKYKKCEELARRTQFKDITKRLLQMCINYLLYADNEVINENTRLNEKINDLEQDKVQLQFELQTAKDDLEKARMQINNFIVEVTNE